MKATKLTMTLLTAALLASASGAFADDPKSAKPAAPAQAGAGVDLRGRFHEGQDLAYTQHTVRDETMSALGQTQTTKLDCTIGWKLHVANASETGADIELTIDSAKGSSEQLTVGPGNQPKKASWDSAVPPQPADIDNPISQSLRPLLGKKLTVKLNGDGEIAGVSGTDNSRPIPGVLQQFRTQLTSVDGIKNLWGPILAIKSGTAGASPGQSWKRLDIGAVSPLGRSKTEITTTLKSVADGVATLTLAGTYEFLGATDAEKSSAKVIDPVLDGLCTWDLKAGNCKMFEWHQKSKISASAQGLEVDRETDSTTSMSRQ